MSPLHANTKKFIDSLDFYGFSWNPWQTVKEILEITNLSKFTTKTVSDAKAWYVKNS